VFGGELPLKALTPSLGLENLILRVVAIFRRLGNRSKSRTTPDLSSYLNQSLSALEDIAEGGFLRENGLKPRLRRKKSEYP
jgi:hypothetical protein